MAPFRFALAPIAAVLVLVTTRWVNASSSYPEVLAEAADAPCPPPCTVCHQTSSGGFGTASKPFAIALMNEGLTANDDDGLESLIASWSQDSDGDGTSDIAALSEGLAPNDGVTELCVLEYGCAVRRPPASGRRWAWGMGFIAVVGVAFFRRSRNPHVPLVAALLPLLASACAESFTPGEREQFAAPVEDDDCVAPRDVFQRSCSGSICHGAGGNDFTSLDLVSPDVAQRVLGAPSSCGDLPLVEPGAPPESTYLMEKLTSASPSCGAPMPVSSQLSEEELDCVRAWVRSLGSTAASDETANEASAGGEGGR